jgi:hypothetical protein
MTRFLTLSAAAASLLFVTTAAEAQWSRSGTATGPGGRTVTTQGGGSCAGGTCTYGGTATGPAGHSITRQGSVTRTAPGQFQSSGSVTGPGGRTATRSGSFSRAR